MARLGARLVLQQALEDEVTEFLGRTRYERTGEPVAYRNGYEPTTVRAIAGPIALERPRLRTTHRARATGRSVVGCLPAGYAPAAGWAVEHGA